MARYSATNIEYLARGLQNRDIEMLRAIGVLRYASQDQLHRLFFPTASLRRVGQRMHQLSQRGIVTVLRWGPPGSMARMNYWRLTSVGVRVTEKAHEYFTPYYRTQAELRLTPNFVPHVVEVGEVWVSLQIAAPEVAARFEFFSGPPARISWEERGKRRVVIPDAGVVTPTPWPNVFWAFLIEVDQGTETLGAIKGKAGRLRDALSFNSSASQGPISLRGPNATIVLVCRQDQRRQHIVEIFRKAGFIGDGRAPRIWAYPSAKDAAAAIIRSVQIAEQQFAESQHKQAEQEETERLRRLAAAQAAEERRKQYQAWLAIRDAWVKEKLKHQGLFGRKTQQELEGEYERRWPSP